MIECLQDAQGVAREIDGTAGLLSALLVRSGQHSDEADAGYLLRLADLNGLCRPEWLFAKLGVAAHGHTRFCPLCLLEKRYWRRPWSESRAPICEEHHLWLEDRCTACGQDLRWKNVQLSRCGCGSAWGETEPSQVDEAVLKALREEGIPWSVLVWCGSIAYAGLQGKPHKVASRQIVATLKVISISGAACLLNWPQGFNDLLKRIRAPSKQGTAQLASEAFPGLAKRIRHIPDESWRARLQLGLDDFIRSTAHSLEPIWHRTKSPPSGIRDLLVAARKSGHGRRSVSTVLSSMPNRYAVRREHNSGRNQFSLQNVDTCMVLDQLNQHCSYKFASRTLHISLPRVRELLSKEVLNSTWRNGVSRRSLDNLVFKLSECLHVSQTTQSTRPWCEVLRLLIPSHLTSQFIDAVCKGQPQLYCTQPHGHPDEGLRNAYLIVADVKRWLAVQSSPQTESQRSWLTITEAAKQLGLKSEVAYHLVNRGLLETQHRQSGRRLAAFVSREAMERFSTRYRPLSRLASEYGIASKHSTQWARSMSWNLVSGPDIDGGRQYFVERELR